MNCLRSCSYLLLAGVLTTLPLRPTVAQTSPAETAVTPPSPGVDVAGMDRAVKPGDDFFKYANGTWLETTEIPADRSAYSAGVILTDLTDRRVADLIQEAAKAPAAPGSDLTISLYPPAFWAEAAETPVSIKTENSRTSGR